TRPSGDQRGLSSLAVELASARASPPDVATSQTSVWYASFSAFSDSTTYATVRPSGETFGSVTTLSARMSSVVQGRSPAHDGTAASARTVSAGHSLRELMGPPNRVGF